MLTIKFKTTISSIRLSTHIEGGLIQIITHIEQQITNNFSQVFQGSPTIGKITLFQKFPIQAIMRLTIQPTLTLNSLQRNCCFHISLKIAQQTEKQTIVTHITIQPHLNIETQLPEIC